MSKNLSNKYGQRHFDSAKKSTTDAIEIASKRAIQKTAEATGDLIGNKTVDKIISVSKNSNANTEMETSRTSPKYVPKKDTYLQKKGNKLLMN